ncbi:ATP-dependent DNA helicase [Methanobrevibacter sp.]|uniref:ATP-dependent DNA helicase n=1 Tax=Methanobrevibacter sp. TaxID=66852 RepID=UPI0025F1171F|nr:ATP-dependent DNA helicase [Methanobrevibacter sp.]MBQ2962609.1 ATP-dependent helicase [Methanobrevibacter sp.]
MEFVGNQRDVIEYGKGTLLVEAGPGSGKTTVIVERIKHLINEGVKPESFLVITFTNKAADNLKFKLRKELSSEDVLKMQISTIHSFCLEYLKNYCSNKEDYSSLTLIDDDTSERKSLFIQKFKGKLGFKGYSTIFDYQISDVLKKFGEYTCFNVDSQKLLSTISDSRVITQDYIDFVESMDYFLKKRIDDYDKPLKNERRRNPEEFDETRLFSKSWYNARFLKIIEAYPTYLELLDEYHYVDYDTLQKKALKELEEDPETPFKTIFVDEFQDTDPLQFRIFQELRKNCDYFTAVGDVDQHIYAFRSSFNDFFDELIRLENLKPIPLDVNFRSTENIVKLTEAFIDPQRKETAEKEMVSNGKPYNNPNFLVESANSSEEASKVYQIISTLIDNGVKESDIAVLYRKHSDKTIAELVERFNDGGIDFSIKGQSDLSDQAEVKSIMILLWYIARNTDIGHIPSKDELKELNLKAFCGEYFETSLFSLDDSTKEYLCNLQDSYYEDVIGMEEEVANKRGVIHNIKNREDQDTLYKIFENLQMPIVDIEEITNPTDKEFFRQLEIIRDEINPKENQEESDDQSEVDSSDDESKEKEEPLTILKAFYKLVALSNLYGYELSYKEIANLAILSQTLSNYELFIYETDFRGALFFLRRAIGDYDSYQKEGSGVQLMTIHAAKGLEFPVTIITSLQKEKFPPAVKDPYREKDYIFPSDTYYTPNDCLEYKTILKENQNGEWVHKTLSIDEENRLNVEEEDRVLYVAMTRAKDVLILSTIGEVPDQVNWIRNHTIPLSLEELSQVEFEEEDEKEEGYEDELEGLEEPVVLNYSKYTQYLSCPFKFDLSFNLGFRRTGSAKAANMGTVFHEIMEDLNLKLLDGKVVDGEELEEIIIKYYKPMFDIKKDDDAFEEFKNHVKEYYNNYSVNREVLESEFKFELFRDNYLLNGAIDLVYKESNGEVVILDYKYAEYDENHIGGYEKQSYIYTSALREIPEYQKYDIKKAIIHFVKSDYQHVVNIDEELMEKEKENLSVVANKIKDEEFKKEPEKIKNCEKCAYRTFCKPKEFAHELYD